MIPTEPKPLSDYFKEGLASRRDGLGLHDNPYSAGSDERREWNAGFCATTTEDDEPMADAAIGDDRERHGRKD